MEVSDLFVKEIVEKKAMIPGGEEIARLLFKYPIAMFGLTICRKDPVTKLWRSAYAKQAEIIREILEKQPKIVVITGWKRTTKTAIGSYLGSSWMLGQCNHEWPGANAMGITKTYSWPKPWSRLKMGLIGGKSFEHVESVLLAQYRELLPSDAVNEWFSRTKQHISLHNKSKCVVRTYDQSVESWKSGAYDFIHLDEEPPLEVMNECLERTRTTKGRIIITVAIDDADVSWLPEACLNPMKFFGTNDFLHFKLGVEDVPEEIYPFAEKQAAYQKYDGTPLEMAVRKGEFSYLSGRWWPELDAKIHVIKAFPIPKQWKKWRFMDAGTAAPTACLWIALSPQGDLFAYREYYKAGTTIDERCRDVIEMSGNKRERESGIWVERETGEEYVQTQLDHAEFHRDAITGDSLDYEYVRAGLNVQPWTTLGQEARREIMRKWLEVDKTKLHYVTKQPGAPRFYIFDSCANLIWEGLKKCYKKSTNERSGTVERRIENKDDHLMDCGEGAAVELRWMIEGDSNQL